MENQIQDYVAKLVADAEDGNISPLKAYGQLVQLEKLFTEAKKQCNINDVSVAKRKLCPTCGSDSLITLSDITYCMNDCCDGVKGHN